MVHAQVMDQICDGKASQGSSWSTTKVLRRERPLFKKEFDSICGKAKRAKKKAEVQALNSKQAQRIIINFLYVMQVDHPNTVVEKYLSFFSYAQMTWTLRDPKKIFELFAKEGGFLLDSWGNGLRGVNYPYDPSLTFTS